MMAREKQVAEKVMFLGKNPLKNNLFSSNLAIAVPVALVLLSFTQRESLVKTQLEVKWKRMKNAEK